MPDERAKIGSSRACQILGGIHRSTLLRWMADGKITPVGREPGDYQFDLIEVEELARQRAEAKAS